MGRKIRDLVLMLLVAGGCLGLTLSVSQGNYFSSTMIYNMVYWAVIVALYAISVLCGFFRMSGLIDYFEGASRTIEAQKDHGELSINQQIQMLKGDRAMDSRLDAFLYDLNHSQSGICDIEDYINDEEIDRLIHRRMLDLIPDVMTSLGILGTFMGLVWGLREFEPSNYEAMTASVSSLVEGIKVAFFTSIYGLSMSLVFSYSMKNNYSVLMSRMQAFLERFHTSVVPSAELEAQNRLAGSQKEQSELLRNLTREFSDQVAHGFAASMAPTLENISQALGQMMHQVTNNQQMFLQDIVDSFVAEMNKSFHLEFDQFEKHLKELNEVISRNTLYTEKLYKNLCNEMGALFAKEEKNMHTAVAELSAIQKKYADALDGLSAQCRQMTDTWQKTQELALKNLAKAEQEASRYWVACNQAMQNYLLEAAEAYQKFENVHEGSGRVLTAMTAVYQKNESLLDGYRLHTEAFGRAQEEFSRIAEEFGRVLAQVQAAGSSGKNVYLAYGLPEQEKAASETADRLIRAVHEASGRQEAVLEESLQRQEELLADIRKTLAESAEREKKRRVFGFRN